MCELGLTFGPAVDERLQRVGRLVVDHVHQHRVDPSAGLDAVHAAHDDLELHVKVLVKVLDPAVVRRDAHPADPLLDERRCHLGLELAHVSLAEEELPVEVGDVDRVCIAVVLSDRGVGLTKKGWMEGPTHVDDVNVFET